MKKITLLLLSVFLLGLGNVDAQRPFPELSTDDSGPWYYIQVLSQSNSTSKDPRADRVLAGVEKVANGEDQVVVYGQYVKEAATEEAIDKQLWRVVDKGNGEYTLVNKFWSDRELDYLVWKDYPRQVQDSETSTWGPGIEEKGAVCLVEATPTTNWKIEAGKTTGYWEISAAKTPVGYEKFPYIHQGNAVWYFGIIMEIEQWGHSLESQYSFVPQDDMIMTVLPREISFGTVLEGSLETATIETVAEVSVFANLTEDIEITIEPAGTAFYAADGAIWNPRTGGIVTIFWYEEDMTEYGLQEAEIVYKAKVGDKEVEARTKLSINYIAKCPVVASPKVENSDEDNWFYIVYSQRGGLFITDQGEGELLAGLAFDETNDGQLWKFIDLGDENYKLVSKTGRQIDWVDPEDDSENGNLFISTATSENTFKFKLREDYDWQLWWNEYIEIDNTGGVVKEGTYLNKTSIGSGSTTICGYSVLGDEGSALRFIKATETIDLGYPKFSDADNSYWYFLQFDRQAKNGKVFQENAEIDEAIHSNVSQAALVKDNKSQQWKFEGDKEEFIIVNRESGKAMAITKGTDDNGEGWDRIITTSENANYFTFEQSTFKKYMIKNITGEEGAGKDASYLYLNDFSGTAICQYVASDYAGNNMTFIPVDNESSIDTVIETDNAADVVIATTYYTLQGVTVGSKLPTAEGIYIVKNLHKSGNVTATKVMVVK